MDPTLVDVATHVQSAGVVRVNMLANLEALINIFANTVEIVAIVIGLALFIIGLKTQSGATAWTTQEEADRRARFKRHLGAVLVKVGLVVPFVVNWLVASARDASLFN